MRTNNATKNACKKSRLLGIAFSALLGMSVLVGANNAVAKDWMRSLFCPSGIAAAIESAASLPKLPPEWRFEKKPLNFDGMFPSLKSTSN